ncbi:MAG TPA: ABC transporter substrate binding protein [Deltaproteobacteria bacterium]|nr:ABC transporter substrate binding protein [Deltaproteobacteria bacterium]
MKKGLFLLLFVLFAAQPCLAEIHFHIDVLQLGDTEAFDRAYDGLLDGLARQGLLKGHNLKVERYVIDFKPQESLWGRLRTYLMIKSVCSRVIRGNPDLVITLGTPATHYFQDRIASAGIPMVYSQALLSASCREDGITGVVSTAAATDILHAAILALPHIKTIGIIHSAGASADFLSEAHMCSERLGLKVISQEIDMSESILPAARQLIALRVDAFLIPADAYYEQGDYRASQELLAILHEHTLPCISSLPGLTEGPLLYLSPDFEALGDATAAYARDIIIEGIESRDLPAVSRMDNNFVVDLNAAKTLGICFRPKTYNLLSMNN